MIEFDIEAQAGGFALRAQGAVRTPGVIGVFGPSGAGKTTLLRATAGLAPIARGRVVMDGEALAGPPAARRIGYVFQDNRLFPHLSVRENLLYGARRAPQSASAPAKLALEDVADALGVAPMLDRRTHALSGGEQKRVALGRALLSQPRLILMDEPLTGIDAARKAEIVALIRAVRARFDATILFVTHDLDEIAALADDLLLLDAGSVVASGPAALVFADPGGPLSDRPDARALIDGTLASVDAAHAVVTIKTPGGALIAPWIEAPLGAALRTQIFARDVTLATAPPDFISVQNILPARIEKLRIRPDKLMLAGLSTALGPLLATVTQPAAERLGLKPGGDVYALVKASAFAPR